MAKEPTLKEKLEIQKLELEIKNSNVKMRLDKLNIFISGLNLFIAGFIAYLGFTYIQAEQLKISKDQKILLEEKQTLDSAIAIIAMSKDMKISEKISFLTNQKPNKLILDYLEIIQLNYYDKFHNEFKGLVTEVEKYIDSSYNAEDKKNYLKNILAKCLKLETKLIQTTEKAQLLEKEVKIVELEAKTKGINNKNDVFRELEFHLAQAKNITYGHLKELNFICIDKVKKFL